MRWLTQTKFCFSAILAVFLLGCVAPADIEIPTDYSGAIDDSVIAPFLEQGVLGKEGVILQYNVYHGDHYNVAAKTCSENRCTLSINLTTYYMSYYDKILKMDAVAEYSSGIWGIIDYTVISETTVRRQI